MGIFRIGFSVCGIFIIDMVLELCLFLDSLIYELADQALRVFFDMSVLSASVQAYSEEIGYIMSRIMVLAGVYALFKLAIMLINYLLDPSKVKDASKNGGAIIKSVLIAIVLLVISPIIFEYLGKFQLLVIENDVIPNLIYGPSEDSTRFDPRSESTKFVNNVFLLFFSPNNNSCDSGGGVCDRLTSVSSGSKGISYLLGYAGDDKISYTPVISGIAGIMLVYYFIIFSIELGKRLLKLAILQVLSPIPIIMSVDPSQKNKLSNFVKAYSGLYIQIFVRIITIYLAFVILGVITSWDGFDTFLNSGMLLEVNYFIKLLLYIAVFQAANELPKLIEEALGVKLGNAPGQSFGSVIKGIIGGGVGLAGGAIAGGIAGGFGGALAGAGSGLVSGATGAAASKNTAAAVKQTVGSIKGSYNLGGRVNNAGGFIPFLTSGAQNFFGGARRDADTLSKFDSDIKEKDDLILGANKKIEGFNKDINVQNDKMSTRSQTDQLRTRLKGSFDRKYGDLDQWLGKDEDYMAARKLLATATDDTERAYLQSELEINRTRVEANYNASKDSYFEQQFADYNTDRLGATVDEDFRSALEDYNSYVAEQGMADRTINTYKGPEDGISKAEHINEKDKKEIQKAIEEFRGKIDKEKANIETYEEQKEEIKDKKKAFEERKDVQARKNRGESKPKERPRNLE